VDLVTVLVLARALSPADFGLTAIAMTLISVVDTVLEVPLILALTSLKQVTRSHVNTAFTLGACRGLLLSLVILAAAWPFSEIYDDRRLVALVVALSVGPIARSLASPRMVQYVRRMSFRQNFLAEFTGKLISSILAIFVVYLGGGYWAIVVGSVASNVTTTIISYVIAPYRPVLSLSRFSEFSTYFAWFSGAQIFSAFSWQFDRILLGYFVTKADLGRYTMASDLAVLPTQSLIGPAMQPLVAAFSSINDNHERLRHAYLKASRFVMTIAAPTCIGMSLTSDLIVNVLLGAKWQEASVYLQWIALSIVLNAFYQPLHSLALATNRTSLIFRLTLTEVCSRLVLVSAGLYFYSLPGVIAARIAISIIMFIASLWGAAYLVGTAVASELGNLWKIALACAIMAVLVPVLRHGLVMVDLNAYIQLPVLAAFGAAAYVGTLFALGVRARDYLVAAG
jgi:O-antigen/teichoic acid export membrane protein